MHRSSLSLAWTETLPRVGTLVLHQPETKLPGIVVLMRLPLDRMSCGRARQDDDALGHPVGCWKECVHPKHYSTWAFCPSAVRNVMPVRP